MEKTELFAYLRGQCLGVLGTLSRDNEPQGALVGYAVTSDLEILFDTVRTSRKYGNMIANPRVSFTVGNTVGKGDERTVQYEGIAEELAANRWRDFSRSTLLPGRTASTAFSGRISPGLSSVPAGFGIPTSTFP
jgi:nitroimidazol reductase NimA-like FMN-containing flavoprotein (pyridoxamine 5'-phosphate oxidase superfamily)